MAVKRPASTSAEVTPTEADGAEVTPVATAANPILPAPDLSPVAVAPEPVVAATVTEPVAPSHQVIYVEAPKPFVAKGNRLFGVIIALLATVIFAALFALIDIIVAGVNHPVDLSFISTLDFYAPVIMFAIGFIILVLIVNRAGWAAHVIGSIFVGLVIFFGATGLILLLHINQISSNEVGQAFSQVLFSSGLIIAALLGREVSLWMGLAIAARGRKVRLRNVEARMLYDQEIAAKRAEYEQANARGTTTAVANAPAVEEPVVAEVPAP